MSIAIESFNNRLLDTLLSPYSFPGKEIRAQLIKSDLVDNIFVDTLYSQNGLHLYPYHAPQINNIEGASQSFSLREKELSL